jgi:iron complex outermembrane receptor protein
MNALNPSVGLIYRVFEKIRLFTNISTSFETPTSTELVNRPDGAGGFNPDLNPARAVEYEAGMRGYINPMLTFDIAGFIIRTKDELIPFQVPDTPGQDYFRNAGSTIHRGGELTFRFSPASFIDLSASLTYINAYYKNFLVKGTDYAGNKIPGISKIHGVAELKLHQKEGLYFSFLTQSYGKMYVDDANSAATTPYLLCDIGIGHEGFSFGTRQVKRIILSGGISNLFNNHYITSVSVNAAANRYYEPGPGRTFYLNARVDFGIR